MTLRIPADLSQLSPAQKDALIVALLAEIEAQKAENAALSARMAELEARLKQPPKTPDNSSTPPSRGQKGNRPAKTKRAGPRVGSLGRQGGGRKLTAEPDQFVTAKPTYCRQCGTALTAGEPVLHGRYDKIDPGLRPSTTAGFLNELHHSARIIHIFLIFFRFTDLSCTASVARNLPTAR
jgi:transposase